MLDLLMVESIPEMRWEHGDDLCDCTFQRIGWWTNPYLGKTLQYRWCCVWKALVEKNPELAELVQVIPAFDNYNTGEWESGPREWDSTEGDMPRALWYRQIQTKTGESLDEIRARCEHLNPPSRIDDGLSPNG